MALPSTERYYRIRAEVYSTLWRSFPHAMTEYSAWKHLPEQSRKQLEQLDKRYEHTNKISANNLAW